MSELWSAIYAPADQSLADKNRFDLPSREAAKEYVFTQMCEYCLEARRRFLSGESDPSNPEHCSDDLPGCSWEWDIMKTDDYHNALTEEDYQKAAGWEVIYRKPE